jgi:hypothetical protein
MIDHASGEDYSHYGHREQSMRIRSFSPLKGIFSHNPGRHALS